MKEKTAKRQKNQEQTIELLNKKDITSGEKRKEIISEITELNHDWIEGFVVSRFSGNGPEVVEELINECSIAFMESIDKYQTDSNATYITYSYPYLVGAVSRYFCRENEITPTIKFNTNKLKKYVKDAGISEEDALANAEETAQNLGWTKKKFISTIEQMTRKKVSLNEFPEGDAYFDCGGWDNYDEASRVEDVVIDKENSQRVHESLKELLTREKLAILSAFYSLDIFPELTELLKTMPEQDALNTFLGWNKSRKYYTTASKNILPKLRKSEKLYEIYIK